MVLDGSATMTDVARSPVKAGRHGLLPIRHCDRALDDPQRLGSLL